jgi:betaine-aldehyde dehydrogenase
MGALANELRAGATPLETADLSAHVHRVLPTRTGHYWGGAWHAGASGSTVSSIDPSTESPLASFACGGAAEADAAVAAAAAAARGWAATAPLERGRLLRRAAAIVRENALELALLDAADCGNPVKAMQMDAEIAATQLEYFAGLVLETKGETMPTANGSLNYTVREPVGVVARIFPFNHPFMFAAGKMAAPLAAGNPVVLKPPLQAPLSTLRLMELLEGVFPPGVLNAVVGGREAGAALARHPKVAAVGLIGSVAAGQAVLQAGAEGLKRSLLELGGKNPMMVYPDADFDAAVDGAIRGMNFTWCGQSCGSTSRVFVHDSLHDRFVEAVRALLPQRHVPGIATDMRTSMGALVDQAQYDRSMGYIAGAREQGARVLCGGGRPAHLARGYFIEPTVLVDVEPGHRVAREEVFGPVLSVLRWSDEDALFDAVNGLEYGLTASIWTRDLSTAHRAAARVQAGYVWINECSIHITGAPFGGYKMSGLGREECLQELHEFTQTKNVNVSLAVGRK